MNTAIPNKNMVHNIRVLLIDDHNLFRAGLAEILQRRGIDVVASVSQGEHGIELVHSLKPDIVLLDIRMPGMTGLEILEKLHTMDSSVAVVMVTTSRDENDIATALRRGARGYLLKDMEPDDLYSALLSIKVGGTVVAPELAVTLARVLQGLNVDKSVDRLADLTPREKEILRYIAEGGSNKVIGRALGITDGTVKLHVKAILRKLDVHSRVEAAVIAVERGLGRR